MTTPQFVWCDREGTGRNVFAIFRRTFALADVPDEAVIELFADTRYRLTVNGLAVARGPAHFVPEHPPLDAIDLAGYLRTGENVLVVEVNSYGTRSCEAMPDAIGGFYCRGAVGEADLATPGDWRVLRADAWDELGPKFCFVQHAVEICDTRRLDPAWFEPGFDDADWPRPAPLDRQDAWGPPMPRPVAGTCDAELRPARIDMLAALADDENRLGCRVRDPDHHRYRRDNRRRFLYATWLHSPAEQAVTLGLFWGPHYLNGRELAIPRDELRGNRCNAEATLRAGWNLLYGEIECLSEVWGIVLGLPADAGLAARARPEFDCPHALSHTGPMTAGELDAARPKVPADADDLAAIDVEWHAVPVGAPTALPARDVAWDVPDRIIDHPPHRTDGIEMSFDDAHAWAVLLDFAGAYLGRVVLDVEAPAGTVVDVAYDEAKRPDGMLRLYHSNPFVDTADRFILRGGRQRIETFHVRGGRYVQLAFRRPTGEAGPVRLHAARVLSATVPVEHVGEFECSDPVFNAAWRMGRATFDVCTAAIYIPDVWRERGLAIADNRLQALIHRTLSTDLAVARHSLWILSRGQRPDGQLNSYMPSQPVGPFAEFTLHWVLWLHDDWSMTGDAAFVESVWDVVEGIWGGSAWQEADSGLWDADAVHPFIDWGATREAIGGRENGCLNAFRFRALQCAAELADAIGRHGRAGELRADANRVADAFRRRLWDADRGRFAAARDEAGQLSNTPPPHVNVLALAYGLADAGQTPNVLEYVCRHLEGNFRQGLAAERRSGYLELYFLHYALEAVYRHGRVREAEQLIRDHWGFLIDRGAWTTWESFRGGRPGSHCHVWSSHPMLAMIHRVVGIRRARPGSEDALLIAPCAATVSRARGRYPHPRGPVDVAWRRDTDRLWVEITAPEGIELTIRPEGDLADLVRIERITRR